MPSVLRAGKQHRISTSKVLQARGVFVAPVYSGYEAALASALTTVPWLGDAIRRSPPFAP
jgi:hypothetical protein